MCVFVLGFCGGRKKKKRPQKNLPLPIKTTFYLPLPIETTCFFVGKLRFGGWYHNRELEPTDEGHLEGVP